MMAPVLADERVEVAAGVYKPLSGCTSDDLAAAQAIIVEKARLASEVQAMVLQMAVRGVSVPDETRERIVAWDESLPALQQLRDRIADRADQAVSVDDTWSIPSNRNS